MDWILWVLSTIRLVVFWNVSACTPVLQSQPSFCDAVVVFFNLVLFLVYLYLIKKSNIPSDSLCDKEGLYQLKINDRLIYSYPHLCVLLSYLHSAEPNPLHLSSFPFISPSPLLQPALSFPSTMESTLRTRTPAC